MTSYVTAKKGSEFITYVTVASISDPGKIQINPTIASGDFKVSTDDGSLANLSTLPTVSPAGSAWIKISLSASEMNGDNVKVQGIDAAGDEWGNIAFNIQTTAVQIDDLSTAAALALVKEKTDQLTFTVAGQVDANAKSMNDAAIQGNGSSGNLWRGV